MATLASPRWRRILTGRSRILAIEAASGRGKASLPGLSAFRGVTTARTLLIGAQGPPLEVALTTSADQLLDA